MDFPAYTLKDTPVTDEMAQALGVRPVRAVMGRDLLCILQNEEEVRALSPDLEQLKALPGLLQHVTARGSAPCDCVSRTFAPKLAVPEDPVCGSGHCHIVPYWASVLGKPDITAFQASRRSGTLYGRMNGDRVYLSGKAALYAESLLHLDF